MPRLVVRSCEIYTEDGVVDGSVVIDDGRIEAIRPGEVQEAPSTVVLDARLHRVFPGLIDLHVHGAGGWAVEAGEAKQIRGMARYLATKGVTAFRPTLAAVTHDDLVAVAAAVRDAIAEPPGDGARILGLHLEGPYLSPRRPGAMNPAFFRNPSEAEIEEVEAVAPGVLRQLTLAPELDGAPALVSWLTRRGVIVSAGHTDATYEEARTGIEAGIRLANHTYNAMRGLHHRDPGALAALVLDERVTCELIADGHHVHPAAIEVLLRLVGRERLCLVSDAVSPAGLPPGTYELFGQPVFITEDGLCRLPNGGLAGSAHFLLQGVRTLVERVGVPIGDAVRTASAVPARVAGVAEGKGALTPGRDADLIVVSAEWKVLWSLVEGRIAHSPERSETAMNPVYR